MPRKASKQFTYQTRFKVDEKVDIFLTEYANIFSGIERYLFTDLMKGKSLKELKAEYIKRFSITARQFNACRMQLEGKIASKKQLMIEKVKYLNEKIKSLEKTISKKQFSKEKLHQKKRKLANSQERLKSLEKDLEEKTIRLCFGSKKLFKAQFNLKENEYQNHQAWLKDWQEARNNSFFCIGSKDESAGNQTCQLRYHENKTFSLQLRLPNTFSQKHLVIPNLDFAYGKTRIIEALLENKKRKVFKNPVFGQAINCRFKKDKKGWYLFVTVESREPAWLSKKEFGAIGIDINIDNLSLSEIDHFGNPVNHKVFSLPLAGKNLHQKKAIIGDVTKEIVRLAMKMQKPVIIEKLDFREKKAGLKEQGTKKYRRKLSSFAYSLITSFIKSKAWREGIEVFEINPAYTSIIGKIKFSAKYGISTHMAAALVIARRYLGYSERPPRQKVKIPFGKDGHVTFFLPARNREKHVWSYWGKVRGILSAKLKAYFQGANKLCPSSSPRKSALVTELLPKIAYCARESSEKLLV